MQLGGRVRVVNGAVSSRPLIVHTYWILQRLLLRADSTCRWATGQAPEGRETPEVGQRFVCDSCSADENCVSAPQERMDCHAVFLSLCIKFHRSVPSGGRCLLSVVGCRTPNGGNLVAGCSEQIGLPGTHAARAWCRGTSARCLLEAICSLLQSRAPPISCFFTSKDSQRRRTSPDWPNTRHHHKSRQMPSRGSLLVPFACTVR